MYMYNDFYKFMRGEEPGVTYSKKEKEDKIEFLIAAYGNDKESISIEPKEDGLNIRTKETKEEDSFRQEINVFIKYPRGIDQENIEARVDKGVITISFKKTSPKTKITFK